MTKQIVRTLMLVLVGFCTSMALAEDKADDVFLDEGDGDFDAVPAVPAGKAETAQPAVPAPAQPTAKVKKESAPKAKPAAVEAKKEAPAPAKPPAQKAKPAKSAEKKSAGIFVTTKSECPMHRAPASDSELMLTVKASKKLWVEEVDQEWVKGFNKAGEAGYISRECLI